MAQISRFLDSLGALFSNLFNRPNWLDILDVVIVSVLIYQVLKLVRQTRANSVIKGLGVVLVVTGLSEVFQLNTLNWLLRQVMNTGAIMLVVLFQPELRRGLEQIGRSKLWAGLFTAERKTRSTDKVIEEMVRALSNLARRKVGALIVMERHTGLNDIIDSGTFIDGEISAPLVENVFEPNTPLHDGAMIVRGTRIMAAACILQLSENKGISRELGTRHRAAIGISETTDAITLIVSEETGIISMAREGRLTRYLDAKSLTTVLGEYYGLEEPVPLISKIRRKGGTAK